MNDLMRTYMNNLAHSLSTQMFGLGFDVLPTVPRTVNGGGNNSMFEFNLVTSSGNLWPVSIKVLSNGNVKINYVDEDNEREIVEIKSDIPGIVDDKELSSVVSRLMNIVEPKEPENIYAWG